MLFASPYSEVLCTSLPKSTIRRTAALSALLPPPGVFAPATEGEPKADREPSLTPFWTVSSTMLIVCSSQAKACAAKPRNPLTSALWPDSMSVPSACPRPRNGCPQCRETGARDWAKSLPQFREMRMKVHKEVYHMARYAAFLYSVVLPNARLRSTSLISFAQDCGLNVPIAVGSTGNLVFEVAGGSPGELEAFLEQRFERHFGKPVPILVRSADEVRAVVEENPFDPETDQNHIAVRLQRIPGDTQCMHESELRAEDILLRQIGRDLWLRFPDRVGPSKVASWIGRSGPVGTFRTFGTLLRVCRCCNS